MITPLYLKIIFIIINISISGSFVGDIIDKPTETIQPTGPIVYIGTDGTANYNCNGINDNVEINKALDYINNIGGGTVYLRGPNTYWISETLEMGPNTILEGDKTATIKLIPNANWELHVPLIKNKINGTSNYTIRGFTIDANSEFQSVSRGVGYYDLMLFSKCRDITVTNMRLQWSTGDGLKVRNYEYDNSANILFANNSVYKLGHEALYALGLNGVIAKDNDVFTRTNSAFRVSCSGYAKIYNNTIHSEIKGWSTGAGIRVDKFGNYKAEKIEIYNNKIYNLNGAGIYISGDDANSGKDVHIHHNIIYDVGQYWNNTGYTNAGILVGQYNNTIIENNVIDGSGDAGIKFYSAPVYSKMNAHFTTTVRNNIIVGVKNEKNYGLWNTDSENHTFISYNNCIYDVQKNYEGNNINFKDDIYINPSFADKDNHDYHLQSEYGRWSNESWVKDKVTSKLIDAGYINSNYSLEPQPNGGRINIGRYGNTPEASKSKTE